MMMRIKKILRFTLVIFVIVSCGNKTEFEQYQKFAKQSWNRLNILKFEVPVTDTLSPFNIELVIRHLPEFLIKELPVNVTIYMPSGEMRTVDHVLNFAGKDGKSLSECLGDLCDITFTLREDFLFPESGTYRIEVENKWPKVELLGIMEVGLILRRTK